MVRRLGAGGGSQQRTCLCWWGLMVIAGSPKRWFQARFSPGQSLVKSNTSIFFRVSRAREGSRLLWDIGAMSRAWVWANRANMIDNKIKPLGVLFLRA